MPTRSNVICRLNKRFLKSLEKGRFKYARDLVIDQSLNNFDDYEIGVYRGELNCCGMEELDFSVLNEAWKGQYIDSKILDIRHLSDKNWNNLIACYIKASCEAHDERIVVVGIPVKVGQSSMYNIDFYKKLRETLLYFGFKELCKPYKNKNSGNILTVLAGQMP